MIWIAPDSLIWKVTNVSQLVGVVKGDWDLTNRILLSETDKHRSMYQRFVEGKPWEETDCFTNLYVQRFKPRQSKNGAEGYAEKLFRYRNKLEPIFESIKRDGFSANCDLPVVLIGRTGEIMLGNQGNHRVAMAKILQLDQIPVEIVCRHSAWSRLRHTIHAAGHPDYVHG